MSIQMLAQDSMFPHSEFAGLPTLFLDELLDEIRHGCLWRLQSPLETNTEDGRIPEEDGPSLNWSCGDVSIPLVGNWRNLKEIHIRAIQKREGENQRKLHVSQKSKKLWQVKVASQKASGKVSV